MDADLTTLPTAALVALGVLVTVQVILDVVALVDLVRRPVDRVTAGNKWLWVAVILLVNVVGAIVYLAVGRRAAPAVERPPAPRTGDAGAASVADALYGPRHGVVPQDGPRRGVVPQDGPLQAGTHQTSAHQAGPHQADPQPGTTPDARPDAGIDR
jgi:hypothetical protein